MTTAIPAAPGDLVLMIESDGATIVVSDIPLLGWSVGPPATVPVPITTETLSTVMGALRRHLANGPGRVATGGPRPTMTRRPYPIRGDDEVNDLDAAARVDKAGSFSRLSDEESC
jgi:hypothetical protein